MSEKSSEEISKYAYPLQEGEDPGNRSFIIPKCPNSDVRSCVKCGKLHDTGIQDTQTGRMIERFDLCLDCWWEKMNEK